MLQMRHLLVILFVSALALLSCGRPDYPAELLAADSLSGVRPDSAKAVLGRVGHGLDAFDDDARWYYRLLRLKVRGKAYDVFTAADSAEAFDILAHYRSGGDSRLLPQAYYYAGCVVRDMRNAPMAIDLFQHGMDAMQDTTDLELRSILNFRIGFLLLDQGVYDHAIPYFRESLRLESLRKDTAMMAFCHEKLAFVYRDKGERDSALCYFDRAIRCANALGDSTFANGFVASLASYYISVKDYRKADSCLAPYLPYVQNSDMKEMYCMAAITDLYNGNYDTVAYYCDFLLKLGNVYQKKTANRLLSSVNLRKGNVAGAIKNIYDYEQLSDSVDVINAADVVARMNASYNYDKFKVENEQLKVERAYYILGGIILLLVIVIISFCFFSSYRKGKQRMQNLKDARLNMQRQSEAYVASNNAKLAELSRKLTLARRENEAMVAALERQKLLMETDMEMARQKQRMSETMRRSIVSSEIYGRVYEASAKGKVLTDDDWRDIESFLLGLIPNFKTMLYGICSISKQDYHMCLLIKMGGFSGKQIASLMGRTDSAISKAKKKLHDLFIGQTGEATIEDFINSL